MAEITQVFVSTWPRGLDELEMLMLRHRVVRVLTPIDAVRDLGRRLGLAVGDPGDAAAGATLVVVEATDAAVAEARAAGHPVIVLD